MRNGSSGRRIDSAVSPHMARATIATYRKHLIARYQRRTNAESVIASAKKLAHLLLSSDELLPQHRKKMLKEVVWLITEADGKYSTRYRSKEVVRLAEETPTCDVKIQHEHVYPRAAIADEILARKDEFSRHPNKLDQLLDEAVGCVVTIAEHRELLKNQKGWKRYKNVAVLDMSTDPPKRVRI